mgnify:FL=1
MIVKFYELKKNLDKNINFFLLYGSNKGLVDETVKDSFKTNSSSEIINYDESDILNNVGNFKEEILNKSFFNDNKLILVNRVSDKILKVIEELIEQKIKDVKIILISSILEKKSKLRSFFEKNKNGIIVPFYEDNNQTLFFLAEKFFKEHNIKISSENINLIVERSKGDRINLKNELKKIQNFSYKKTSISTNEIIKLTNLAENYNISELVDQCLAKNKKKTLRILNENNSSQEDNIIILKTFLFKLKRLKKLKIDLEEKKNIDTVLNTHKPPIFWKDKDVIKQQLKVMTLRQINQLMNNINDLELLIKKNSQISNQITNNFILESCKINNEI